MIRVNTPLIIAFLVLSLIITGCNGLNLGTSEDSEDYGRLSGYKALPGNCMLTLGMSFNECKFTDQGLYIDINNGMGVEMRKTILTLNTSSRSEIECNQVLDIGILENGAKTGERLMCAGNYSKNYLFDAEIRIIYIKAGETLSHTVKGSINRKVE